MKNIVIEEMKRLHKMGFAIHWLRPQSKAPVKIGWTSGQRDSVKQLITDYKGGMNIGVRLGKASNIGDLGYLAVIDCDVKSTDKKHRREMEMKVRELLPKLANVQTACVMSGRGGGSCHFYVRTDEPATPARLAQSYDVVKVKMPSAKPSQKELSTLSQQDIDSGYRLRAAWEISLMGEGQQVVLPPSIHPDTKRAYEWAVPLETIDDLVPIVPPAPAVKVAKAAKIGKAKVVDFDESLPNLSPRMQGLIEDGNDSNGDGSADLMSACVALCSVGYTDAEILTICTHPDFYISEVARKRRGENRESCMQWVAEHTLRKARYKTSAACFFEENPGPKSLGKDEGERAQKKLVEDIPWQSKLVKQSQKEGAPLKCCFANVKMIIDNAVSPHLFLHNSFAARDTYGAAAPWGREKGDELKDSDKVRIKEWLVEEYGFEPNTNIIDEVIVCQIDRNKFHPVQEFLKGLKWDGKERVETWLVDYLGAVGPKKYLREVSRKFLVAMVARVMQPGIKFDTVLVLEGLQEIGKSSAASILASPPWFCDTLPDLKDKDAALNLQGAWVVEMPELANLRRSDLETTKAFITRRTDRLRPPYGRRWVDYPRQNVFIGTTNEYDYLKDKTGNRRFWPVTVHQCKFAELQEAREQLFAEAYWIWRNLGENLWLDDEQSRGEAKGEQSKRVGEDEQSVMTESLANFLKSAKARSISGDGEGFDESKFRLIDLFQPGKPWEKIKEDNAHFQTGGRALLALGFRRKKIRGNMYWSGDRRG